MNWREIINMMGIREDDLSTSTKKHLKGADDLCKAAGGKLVSRQVIGNIIYQHQPSLAVKVQKQNRGD